MALPPSAVSSSPSMPRPLRDPSHPQIQGLLPGRTTTGLTSYAHPLCWKALGTLGSPAAPPLPCLATWPLCSLRASPTLSLAKSV